MTRHRPFADLSRLVAIVRVAVTHLAGYAVCGPSGNGRRGLGWLARRLPGHGLGGPERLRTALESLGGTFIKLGQMLALQPDILSLAHCNALFKLLDRVEPFAWHAVERTFVDDLGRRPQELFDRFERRPFAAASVAQVHRARLGGRELAVKVRRPSVETDFAGDLRLMRAAMTTIRRLRLRPGYWLLEPLGEFVAWTEEELDFTNEARYLERLRAHAADNPHERVPAVVGELSGRRLLVMEYLDGPPVLAYVRAVEAGDELAVRRLAASGFEPRAFARAIVDNFLSDAFRHGLFHADLHPANLLILPANAVGYVDFGITGVLSLHARRHLVAMTLAYTRGDVAATAAEFFAVSTSGDATARAAFRRGLERLAAGWYGTGERSGGERRAGRGRRPRKSFTLVMLDMLRLSRATGVLPEREVVKYIRSAIAIDGLIQRFAPGFDLPAHLEAVCARHLERGALVERLSAERWLAGLGAGGRLARDGAPRATALLDRLAAGELPVRFATEPTPADEPPAGRRPLVAAGFVLAASLLLAGRTPATPDALFAAQAGLWAVSLLVFLVTLHRRQTATTERTTHA